MASTSSSDPGPKSEARGSGGGGGGIGRGGGESLETTVANEQLLLYRGLKKAKKERGCTAKERISKMPPCTAGKRSSIYRGVTRHRWTGRYEAHLWDKSTWNQNQNKKGKQVYLGAYDDEEAAARAYDLAALKYWGPGTLINFPVSDYTRDLAEMQNVSREEYLASLRRKSSGFSRGITKYRGISSRWDSFGQMAAPDCFNSIRYGDDQATESDFLSNFGIDRKIDLTNHIKWWGANKVRQVDSSSKSVEDIKHGHAEDVGGELRALEQAIRDTEPYQMPRLGIPIDQKKQKGSMVTALSILSQSPAYKNLQEKLTKAHEEDIENDENANKNVINAVHNHGKAIEKPSGASFGPSGALPLQRNVYPLTSILSAPFLTSYCMLDHMSDPVLWTPFAPVLQAGSSHNSEVTKTETSSSYTFLPPEE